MSVSMGERRDVRAYTSVTSSLWLSIYCTIGSPSDLVSLFKLTFDLVVLEHTYHSSTEAW